jgi:hypothetical protein
MMIEGANALLFERQAEIAKAVEHQAQESKKLLASP